MLRLGIYPTRLVSLLVHYHQADRRRLKTFYPSPNISPPVLKLCASIKIKIVIGCFVIITHLHHKNMPDRFFAFYAQHDWVIFYLLFIAVYILCNCLIPVHIGYYDVMIENLNKHIIYRYLKFNIVYSLPETRCLLSNCEGEESTNCTTKVYKQCRIATLQFHSFRNNVWRIHFLYFDSISQVLPKKAYT